MFSPLIGQLITALRCLPGVGPKSAQRMTFHLLDKDKKGGEYLARTLQNALQNVGKCELCRTLSENRLCNICSDYSRDQTILCVVETPADVMAVEQTGVYKGLYFVLMGRLSPLDGVGPEELGIELFMQRIEKSEILEVIIATNTTVEGEATAYYLAEIIKKIGIATTRIAHGVPLGGELEHIDGGTLSRALDSRENMVS